MLYMPRNSPMRPQITYHQVFMQDTYIFNPKNYLICNEAKTIAEVLQICKVRCASRQIDDVNKGRKECFCQLQGETTNGYCTCKDDNT